MAARDQRLVEKLTALAERGATPGERNAARLILDRILIRLQTVPTAASSTRPPAVSTQRAYPMPARSDRPADRTDRPAGNTQPAWDQYRYESVRLQFLKSRDALLAAGEFGDSAMLDDYTSIEAELNRLDALRISIERQQAFHLPEPVRSTSTALVDQHHFTVKR